MESNQHRAIEAMLRYSKLRSTVASQRRHLLSVRRNAIGASRALINVSLARRDATLDVTTLPPPTKPPAADPATNYLAGLSRRQRQTLELLLKGDSEKQVAQKLGLSRNTVHLYVTALYRHFDVHSRGELLARCLATLPNQ